MRLLELDRISNIELPTPILVKLGYASLLALALLSAHEAAAKTTTLETRYRTRIPVVRVGSPDECPGPRYTMKVDSNGVARETLYVPPCPSL